MAARSRTSRMSRADVGSSSGTERNSGPSAGAFDGRSTMRASTLAMSDGVFPLPARPPSGRREAPAGAAEP